MPQDGETYTTNTTEEEREQALIVRQKQETALDRIKAYAALDEVKERFIALLGDADGRHYVESIVIAVANSEDLQKCSPKSIMIQAMRSASMGLSVDPIMKQAHLVPFGNEATLIVDYHGLVQLSVNTNYYADPPNVTEIYEGEDIKLERLTGRCEIVGERTSDKVIGWLAYFKAKNGTERFKYMTNEQCDAHGEKYNPGGFKSPKSPWNAHNGRDRDKMRRKTVLRQLVSEWGNFSPHVQRIIMQDEPVEGEVSAMPSDENLDVPEHVKDPNGLRDLFPEIDKPENDNQETGKPAKPIELIDTMGDWAVKQAAKAWNISSGDAAKAIAAKNPAKMSKPEFVKWLDQPA